MAGENDPATIEGSNPDIYLDFMKRHALERKRLDEQFEIVTSALGFLLHPAIRSTLPARSAIADIATGTGIFLHEVSTQHPDAVRLDGYDISVSMVDASRLPPPIKVTIHNAKVPFSSHLHGQYDVIHIRYLVCAMEPEEWAIVLSNLLSLLKSGGAIQWTEPDIANIEWLYDRTENDIPSRRQNEANPPNVKSVPNSEIHQQTSSNTEDKSAINTTHDPFNDDSNGNDPNKSDAIFPNASSTSTIGLTSAHYRAQPAVSRRLHSGWPILSDLLKSKPAIATVEPTIRVKTDRVHSTRRSLADNAATILVDWIMGFVGREWQGPRVGGGKRREDVVERDYDGKDRMEDGGGGEEKAILAQEEADSLKEDIWKDVQERGVFPRYDVYCFVGWKK